MKNSVIGFVGCLMVASVAFGNNKPRPAADVKSSSAKEGTVRPGTTKAESDRIKDNTLVRGKVAGKEKTAREALESIKEKTKANLDASLVSNIEAKGKDPLIKEALNEMDKRFTEASSNGFMKESAKELTEQIFENLSKLEGQDAIEFAQAMGSVSADAVAKNYASDIVRALKEAQSLVGEFNEKTGTLHTLKTAIEKKLSEYSQAKTLQDLINCKKG